jgi:K+-sensing histidine kinase KdpD
LPPRDNIGLGVWTVCLLASRLGARIEAKNNDPTGTTILVTLPVKKEVRLVAVA